MVPDKGGELVHDRRPLRREKAYAPLQRLECEAVRIPGRLLPIAAGQADQVQGPIALGVVGLELLDASRDWSVGGMVAARSDADTDPHVTLAAQIAVARPPSRCVLHQMMKGLDVDMAA